MSDTGELDFSTLLAASVHDMKNSVSWMQQLIDEKRQQSASVDLQLEQLSTESSRLQNYLMQMLVLYKLEQHQYPYLPQSYYLDELLDDAVAMHQSACQLKGLSLQHCGSAEVEWEFDHGLVNAVLNTIMDNAQGFAKSHIALSAEVTEDQYLCLSVEDDGPGFPESMMGELASHQLGVDFIRSSTGFGIYFTQQVAAFHRASGGPNGVRIGYVELHNNSALGGGVFKLYLP